MVARWLTVMGKVAPKQAHRCLACLERVRDSFTKGDGGRVPRRDCPAERKTGTGDAEKTQPEAQTSQHHSRCKQEPVQFG